ncbi:MAG: class I SAM-dependent methyltransferase [Pseudonocardiaceae bacterium]
MTAPHAPADPYRRMADLYDLWVSTDPARAGSERFYLDLALSANGPVLELGTGTGRIALALAAVGVPVVGVDNAPEMLAVAGSKLAARPALPLQAAVELVQGDVLTYRPAAPVGLAVLPLRTVGHFHTPTRLHALLSSVREMLQPDGLFAFDHFVVHADGAGPLAQEEVVYAGPLIGGCSLVLRHSQRAAPQSQELLCELRAQVRLAGGSVSEERCCSYVLGWVSVQDVRHAAHSAGFEVQNLFGSFDQQPFGPGSREQVWVLRRRPSRPDLLSTGHTTPGSRVHS